MADKLRVTFPIAVDFSDGELPSAAKLNGVSHQAKQGLSIIEYALGDVWNQSGDSLLATQADAQLMIPSLARHAGAPRLVSPRIPNLPELNEYTYDFTVEASNSETETRLPYPVHSTSTFTWSSGGFDSTPKSNKSDVVGSGDWWLDYETGEILSYDLFISGQKLTYKPGYYDASGSEQEGIYGDISEDATFNTIPDPDTNTAYNFRGLKIQYKNGADDSEGYLIYLPPRMPLNSRRLEISPQNTVDVPTHAYNFFTDPDSYPSHSTRYWMTHTSDAPITAGGYPEHYRYNLPKIITDNWSQSSVIPAGFVYLWDPNGTGTIIEGLVFYAENAAVPKTWMLIATGSNLTTWLSTTQGQLAYPAASLKSSSHAPAYYPNNGLRLITTGVDTSTALSSLLGQFLNHNHSEQGSFPGRRVSHALLGGLFDNHDSVPYFDASGLDKDDHPQYLHRKGFNANRDKYGGAMLGDMLIGSSGSSNDYQNITSDSFSLQFGRNTNGVNILWNHTSNKLNIQSPSGAGATGVSFTIGTSTNQLDIEQTSATSNHINSSSVPLQMSSYGDMTLTSNNAGNIVCSAEKFICGAATNWAWPLVEYTTLYFSSVAKGWSAQMIELTTPARYMMSYKYGGEDFNADNCITTFPGEIDICQPAEGASLLLAQSSTAPQAVTNSSIRLLNKPVGQLSITREDAYQSGSYADGEDGSIIVNNIYAGGNNDSTYGYSGTYTSGWGPVRRYTVSPAEMVFSRNVTTAVDNTRFPVLSYDASYAGPMRAYHSVSYTSVIDSLNGILPGLTGGYESHAIFPIHFPYNDFCIVQVQMSYRWHSVSSSWTNDIRMSLGYSTATGDTGGIYSTVGFASIGGPSSTSWSSLTNIFPVSTTSPLMSCKRDSTNRFWLDFSYLGSVSTQDIEFRGLIIHYRIKEW